MCRCWMYACSSQNVLFPGRALDGEIALTKPYSLSSQPSLDLQGNPRNTPLLSRCFQDASNTPPTHLQDPQEASKTLPKCFQEAAKTLKNLSKHHHACNFCFDFDFLRFLNYFVLYSTNIRPIKINKNHCFLQLFRASAVYGLA